MHFKPWRILPLLGCGFLTACSCSPTTLGALRVVVTVDDALPADCLELEVQSGGSVLASTVMERVPGKTEYLVAALQGDLPATVDLQAKAYLGLPCSDRINRHLNGRSEVSQGTFPKKGINEARVTVALPDATLDADQDHYVGAAQGGVDCDDTNPLVHPFQTQTCVSPLDTDCDGRVGCNDSDCTSQPACLTTPTQLAFSPSALTVHANDCSAALTLEVHSLTGLAPVGQQTTVALTVTGVPLQFFTDATCTTGTSATQVVLPFGSSSQTLYARGAMVGTATVTANSGVLTSASALVTVDPQPVVGFAFVNPLRSITAGGCSQEFTVQAQDAQHRPTTVMSATALALSGAPSQGLTFHDATDTTCAIGRSSVSLVAGTDAIGFRVSGTRAGPTQLTATGGNLTAQQTLTISPAAVAGLGFSTPQPGVQAATCSGAPVTVQLQDTYGNAAPTASLATVTLSVLSGPAGGVFTYYPAVGCASGTQVTSVTIAAGQSSASVYIMGSMVGSYTMQADSGGQSTTQPATISSGPPDHLFFAVPAVTATSGGCSSLPVKVQTQDSTNASSGVVAPVTVTLTQTPAGAATLYSDSACTMALNGGNTLDFTVGATEVPFYFRGTVARTFRVDATAPGLAAANQGETIQPGSANTMQWNPSPTVLSADAGICAGPFALDIKDLNGNPTSFGAVTALTPSSASSTAGATLAFAAGATCSPTSASVSIGATAQSVSFYATTNKAAAYTVSASTPLVSATGTASLTVGPAAPDRLVIISSAPTSVVAGSCLSVTVERRDALGNPVPVSAPVTLTLSSSGGPALSFFATPGSCPGTPSTTASISTGATTTFAVRGIVVGGPATVTVASTGLTSATFQLSITPSAATHLAIQPLPATVTAGQCVSFTEQREDDFGNVAPESSSVLITLSPTSGISYFTNNLCTAAATNADLASGAGSRTLYFKSTVAGPLTLAATQTAPSTLTPGSAATTVVADVAARLTLSALPGQIDAGSCQPLTEAIVDQFGNSVGLAGGLTVTPVVSGPGAVGLAWFTENTCTTGAADLNIGPGLTSRVVYLKATKAGALSVSAHGAGFSTADPTASTTVLALTSGKSLVLTVPAQLNTYACTAFTITRVDAYLNPSPDPAVASVALSGTGVGSASVGFFSDATCATGSATATLASGSPSTLMYVKAVTVGALVVGADGTSAGLGTTTASTNVVQPVVSRLFFTTLTGSVKAGACSGLLTVQAQDAAGAPVIVAADLGVTLTSGSAGPLTFHKASDCSDAVPGPFAILAGSSTVQFAFSATKAPEQPLLRASTGTVIADATQQWTVTAGDPTGLVWTTTLPIAATRYGCTAVSLGLVDAFGNVANATADVVATLLATSVSGDIELFATSACSGSAMVTPIATIANGNPSVTFGLVAFGSGPATLGATATGVTNPADATIAITGAQGALNVVPAVSAIEAGACVPVTIARRNSGSTPVTWGAATTVTLGTGNASLISVHPDAACAAVATTVDITPGNSSATLYVRGHSSPSTLVTLTALEPSGRYGTHAVDVTALPLVRTGTCNIAAAASSNTCALTPVLPLWPGPAVTIARSFLVFQAQSTSGAASSAHVECHLAAASPAVNVVCSRVGTATAVTVNYQVVSWGRDASAGGVTVQHVTQATAAGSANPLPIALSPAVVPAETFVLFSSTATDGTNEHSNVFPVARLDGGTQLLVGNPTAFTTGTISAQVVDFAGAVVTRGLVSNGTLPYSSLAVTSLPAPSTGDVSKSFTLHSVRTTSGGGSDNNTICKRRFSGYADSPTSLLFSRSAGANNSSNCNSAANSLAVTELDWERIDLPGASLVQMPSGNVVTLANNGGGTAGNAAFTTAVAQHKTIFLLSGQGPGGQTAGESSDTGSNPLSTLHALLSWNSTTSLTVSRLTTTGAADFYPYIIEFDP